MVRSSFLIILSAIQGDFTEEQLQRAKTQLTCEYLREMEVRPTMFEAFARETQEIMIVISKTIFKK